MARGLKFRIYKDEGLYYPYRKKTMALSSCAVTAHLICVFVFAYAKNRFSHDATHISVAAQVCSNDLMTKLNFLTVMIINFRTDRSEQTVETQIRLLIEEQSDQVLHCLPFHLHIFDKIPSGFAF